MVQLTEELGGLSLKRKGADDPELFAVGGDDRSGFPLSCRATKMRRLACPDGQHCRPDEPVVLQGQVVDLPMGDAAPSPAATASTAAGEENAMVLYGGGQSAPRLRPCGAHVRAGADWVRAMLREADSRTVRELLASAQEQGSDLALAVVPWVPPSPRAEEAEPSAAEEEEEGDGGDSDSVAAMDVEEEDQVHHWTRQQAFGCGEGYMYQWPQHCMAPPQLPVVGQASPVMWSW